IRKNLVAPRCIPKSAVPSIFTKRTMKPAWKNCAPSSRCCQKLTRNMSCAIAIEPADRKDDVKLSGALQRLGEEDAALVIEHDDANHEIRLRGVNDEHLNTVIARLKRRYGVEVKSPVPAVGYRESIRKTVTQKGRHKKQSGGHGQFGDVIIEVKPLPRGSGFHFEEKIHGGSVPKQWIPAVE